MDGEGLITELRELIQDLVAPRVRELTAEMRATKEQIVLLRSELKEEITGLRHEMEQRDTQVLRAIDNASLRGTVETQRDISELRERMTRLEERIRPRQ